MTMTLAMFALMMVAVRELARVMSTFEILAFRSFVALIILLPVAVHLGRAACATRRLRFHITRNAVHFAAQYGWMVGIALLPRPKLQRSSSPRRRGRHCLRRCSSASASAVIARSR